MNTVKVLLFIVILLVLGYFYRLQLNSASYTELYSDMYRYHELAERILSGQIAADCCEKNPGYSVYLSFIYRFFGAYNDMALRINQILLDLITALLVFLAARNLFSQRTAIVAFVVYITNPFTGAFAGIRLPEGITFFIIGLLCFLLSLKKFKNVKILWLAFGLTLGLLLFMRAQFQYFVPVLILVLVIFVIRKLKLLFVYLTLIGFLLGSSYTLVANYVNFHKISFVFPYCMTWEVMYYNFFTEHRWPELFDEHQTGFTEYTAEIYKAYWATPMEQRNEFDKQYRSIFFEKFKTDWKTYVFNVMRNFIWGWDKYHISELVDPYYPKDTIPLRIYNIILLSLTLYGMIHYSIKVNRKAFRQPFFLFTVVLFCYISGVFSLIDNETRHRLPFYVLVMIWSGYSIEHLLSHVTSSNRTNNEHHNSYHE